MRALIIDDEPLARQELRRLLLAHPQIQIAGEARDGDEALNLIAATAPDVVFLDIQMPGMDGFELLNRLPGDVPQVIFTTAYDQHAIRAFEVNALDYLLKPIAPERLAAAIDRLAPARTQQRLSQVFIREGERCWIVRLPEIFLLESEGNYTRVHFGGERPLIRRSLNSLEPQLDPASFFRANRRQILNLQHIAGSELGVGGELIVTLRNQARVELSRRQSDRLKQLISL